MSDHPSIPKNPVIDQLDRQWRALIDLGMTLSAADLDVSTDNPGWSVRDNLTHVIGTELALSGATPPEIDLPDLDHVRNDIGKLNELWIEARRSNTADEVVAELAEVTGARLETLRAMSQDDWDAESWTPAGMATFGRFMQIRVFDCWMHEQDVREALGRPGHLDGPCAEASLDEIERSLGFIVGKRGEAPDGSRVQIDVTGETKRTLRVAVDGRAQVVDAFDGEPTISLAIPFRVFMRLTGGRASADPALADGTIDLAGDLAAGERIARNLAFVI